MSENTVEKSLHLSIVNIERDRLMESHKWAKEIPALSFKSDWSVKIVPPSGGAVVRFVVGKGLKSVSVYLDCYDNLGCMDEPYWEIYPYGEDTYRTTMNDVEGLMNAIEEELS